MIFCSRQSLLWQTGQRIKGHGSCHRLCYHLLVTWEVWDTCGECRKQSFVNWFLFPYNKLFDNVSLWNATHDKSHTIFIIQLGTLEYSIQSNKSYTGKKVHSFDSVVRAFSERILVCWSFTDSVPDLGPSDRGRRCEKTRCFITYNHVNKHTQADPTSKNEIHVHREPVDSKRRPG